MALTGLEIYKHLPKTNCKDCGLPTCLAFAMKMATKQISLEKCPHVTPAAKAALESSSRPPIQLVTIGSGDAEVKIGNETQLYRHEEKFHRPTAIAVRISDTLAEDALAARAAAVGKLSFDRVGLHIHVNLVAVDNESGDAGRFEKAAALAAEKSGLPCVLMSSKAENLRKAAAALAGRRPLLYISDSSQAEAAGKIAQQANCPLARARRRSGSPRGADSQDPCRRRRGDCARRGHAGLQGDAGRAVQDSPAFAEELPPPGVSHHGIHRQP